MKFKPLKWPCTGQDVHRVIEVEFGKDDVDNAKYVADAKLRHLTSSPAFRRGRMSSAGKRCH